MDLRITQTYAKLGFYTDNAQLSIQQPRPDLELRQVPAQLDIHTEAAQVLIDQSQAFAEAGLKNPFDLTRELAQKARQAALQGMARRASEGKELMAIEHGGNAIAAIGFRTLTPGPDNWTIGFIPSSGPKFEVKPYRVNVEFQAGGVEVEARVNPPVIEATAGKVNYEMLQYNSIRIDHIGQNLNKVI